MTPAELKTLMESTGQTINRLAALFSVTRRTVERWISGANPIPGDIEAGIKEIDALISNSCLYAVEQIASAPDGANIVLLRYSNDNDLEKFRPDDTFLGASGHAALIDRIRIAAQNIGRNVRIAYMQPDQYKDWLAAYGLQDNEQNRAAWAAGTIQN